jgi:hypothetical protein
VSAVALTAVTALLLVAAGAAPPGAGAASPAVGPLAPAAAPDGCPAGTRTTMAIEVVSRPEFPRHDQNIGGDRVVVRARDGQVVFSRAVDDGHLLCLGFADSPPGRYLVGVIGEVGAWLVLRSVLYLGEDGSALRPSAFSDGGFLALAAIASPHGRFVAFIGGKDQVDGLYVLDVARNQVRRLGAPPAPPPLDFECDDRFGWGTCWADGYTAIEPAVLRFENDQTLVATYGRDTHRARAKQRRTKRFKL